MTDMDSILTIVENPTRRKILQALVKEPHYPLQLSLELGISQQAIVKNLALMEKMGLLEHYRESSKMGPDRMFYRPVSEFSMIIDLRDNIFDVRMTSFQIPEEKEKKKLKSEDKKKLDETRMKIARIDRQIAEFDKQRMQLMKERSEAIDSFLSNADLGVLDYPHRSLLYEMLNHPGLNAEELSKRSGIHQSVVSEMIDDIVSLCRDDESAKEGDENGNKQ